MELLRNIIIDFSLFSLWEGIIFVLFFVKIGGCNKFKWWEILLLSLVNCVVSQTLPPLIYQFIGLIYMSIYTKITNKFSFISSIKIVGLASVYMLVLEMVYSIILVTFFKLDSFNSQNTYLFWICIPLRIFEIILILFGGYKMKDSKWWIGSGTERR